MTESRGEENPNRYPDRPRVAVGAVVLRDGAVLLVKRAFPPSEGVWAIPGGGVLLGETLREAAEREIREETGVEIRALEPVAAFDVIEKDDAGRIRFHYVIVDLSAEWVAGEPCAASDAADARWVTAEEMDTLPLSRRTRRLLAERFGFGA